MGMLYLFIFSESVLGFQATARLISVFPTAYYLLEFLLFSFLRAPSTVKKYLREGVLFQTFLRQHRLPEALPTSAEHVPLYLSLVLEKNQASAVSMPYSVLKWIHGLLLIPYNLLDVSLCQKLVDAE